MNYEKEIGNLNKDATRLLEKYEEKIKEIERLNNIINELEKYIAIKMNSFGVCNASDIYYKLQELKGEEYMKDKEYEYMQEYLIQKGVDKE